MATILIADDSWVARLGMNKLLVSLGHTVLEATDGKRALEVAEQHPVEILFLDLLMPELDGFGVLEALRGKLVRPKVYVLSADIQETTRQRCVDLGVDGFLNKPPLRSQIEEVLKALA
ncbi:MAG: response regulator [Spirochaetales bacterium]